MKPESLHIIYFSPTHTSAKIARSIGKGTGLSHIKEIDLTCDSNTAPLLFRKDELAIIAAPVYAGRVAPIAKERFKRLKGNNTPAILSVTYGNRDYEDALVELRDLTIGQGFIPLAAGAFIGEHSYSRPGMPIAEGRPDLSDTNIAVQFGKKAIDKIATTLIEPIHPLFIKGNIPYREVKPSSPAAPITLTELCSLCGECIGLCPTQAIFINPAEEIDTDKTKCIKCCACVKDCPNEARIFDTPYTAMLHANFSARREPELFF